MEHTSYRPEVLAGADETAFLVWLGRALKSCHDDAVNEPLPAKLLDLLPPPSQPQR